MFWILKTSKQVTAASFDANAALQRPASSYDPYQDKGRMTLSSFLAQEGIVIWKEPVPRDVLLQRLTEIASQCTNHGHQSLKYLSAILERENQGSTFFNEGVAFPHARIEGLERACLVLGLTHKGVSDLTTDKPIEGVFLILSPMEDPDLQIRILALASKAAQDRQLMEMLSSALTHQEAYRTIRDWELLQGNRPD